jgi:hypothetical protein
MERLERRSVSCLLKVAILAVFMLLAGVLMENK